MKIGVLDYGLGNMGSVCSAFQFYRHDVSIVSDPSALDAVDLLVMAGVGNFKAAVTKIKERGLWDSLNEAALIKRKPILGICLGMQLFADVGHEDGESRGFGWISGTVKKMDPALARVPHMGWNQVSSENEALFRGIQNSCFYFMHSYHFIPKEQSVVVGRTTYGDSKLISMVQKDNITGVQFHPEKSQGDGLRFLRNLVEMIH